VDDSPILICYDGSDAAIRAIGAAAELLGPRRAVILDLGPVITEAESLAAIGAVVPYGYESTNAGDALVVAQDGAQRARRAGFDAEARGGVAAPTFEGIVEVADDVDAAVIVLGSRGLAGARELLEGSVSHQVAEHAGRPVLVVPPPRARSATVGA
jgi:nucleotide-binding universal stress UspA family protein